MRLGDMNKVEWKQLNDDMEARIGWKFNKLEKQSTEQVSAMLESTDTKLTGLRKGKNSHDLHNSATYNGMLLAKQVLESYLSESSESYLPEGKMSDSVIDDSEKMTKAEFAKKHGKAMADEYYESVNEAEECKYCGGDCPNDEDHACDGYLGDIDGLYEAEEVMELDTNRLVLEADTAKMIDRVMTSTLKEVESIGNRFRDGGTLHKAILAQGGKYNAKSVNEVFEVVCNEITSAHYDSLSHHNVSEATPMMEDEVGEAEALMAAQDMVDRIQGMLEDVGEMLNEELPPLTDSLRRSAGADAAGSFNSSASETLNSLLEACRSSREAMANSVAGLSGGEPTPMGDIETVEPDAEPNLDVDDEVDLDDFEASDAAIGGDKPLGRAKRD